MTAGERNRYTIDGVRGLLGLDPLYPRAEPPSAMVWCGRLQACVDAGRNTQTKRPKNSDKITR